MSKFGDLIFGSDEPYPEDPEKKDELARGLTVNCAYGAAVLTSIPIPVAGTVAKTTLNVGMIIAIGEVYGVEMNKENATQLLLRIGGVVGLSLVGTTVAVEGAKLIPFVGFFSGLIGSTFAFANTMALGMIAREYFKNGCELSDERIKSIFKRTAKQARKDYDPKGAEAAKAKQVAEATVSEAKTQRFKAVEEAAVEEEPKRSDTQVLRLERLKSLLDKGLIEDDEYDAAKKRVLDEI